MQFHSEKDLVTETRKGTLAHQTIYTYPIMHLIWRLIFGKFYFNFSSHSSSVIKTVEMRRLTAILCLYETRRVSSCAFNVCKSKFETTDSLKIKNSTSFVLIT